MSQESERFKEIRAIGRGRFGQTLLVEDRADGNRPVVIKVPIDKSTELALINELVNTAILFTSLRKVEHPNIVKYLGFDRYKELVVLILEYVDGRDLSEVMGRFNNRPPLDVNLALRIAIDVCSGLVAAHGASLFHSDLKPANILVREKDGVAKLCDFGVSSILRSTSAAEFAGTLLYSAPELLGGRASFQADLWSLSVILYEMVTGAVPFAWTGNAHTFKAKVDTEHPAPPKRLNPQVDDRLNALILRGLEKDTNKRFKNAQDMLTALQACMAPDAAPPMDEPSTRTTARRVVGALSALAFAAAAVVYVRQPPSIEKLTCSPCVLEAGKTTTLSWTTKGAAKVLLERDPSPSPVTTTLDTSGAFADIPKQRTAYTLVATSRFGVTARSGKITVVPVDISLSSTSGFFPMLSWKVSEPTAKVSLSSRRLSQPTTLVADNLPPQGSRVCEPYTTYVLNVSVDGVKFEKSTFILGRSTFPSILSQPDALPSQVTVVGSLLFFESASSTPPAPGSRKYQTSFTASTSRLVSDPWIFWQLTLKNEGSRKSEKFPTVAVWYKKKPLLDSYEEVSRSNASDLETPDPGQTNTSRGGWNGGSLGWLMRNSLLVSSSLLRQSYFRVELYVGATKIASGEFSVRSRLFTPDKQKK